MKTIPTKQTGQTADEAAAPKHSPFGMIRNFSMTGKNIFLKSKEEMIGQDDRARSIVTSTKPNNIGIEPTTRNPSVFDHNLLTNTSHETNLAGQGEFGKKLLNLMDEKGKKKNKTRGAESLGYYAI